jgi:hypothetical protein
MVPENVDTATCNLNAETKEPLVVTGTQNIVFDLCKPGAPVSTQPDSEQRLRDGKEYGTKQRLIKCLRAMP